MICSNCGGTVLKDDGEYVCLCCARRFDENGSPIKPQPGKKHQERLPQPKHESNPPLLADLLNEAWNED